MKQNTFTALSAGIIAMFVLSSFGAMLLVGPAASGNKMQVVASFYPLWYFSSEIGKDRADVYSLIPDNAEPHAWEPRPTDIMRVSRADVFVYNGEGFEPWVSDLLSAVGTRDLRVVDTSRDVQLNLDADLDAFLSSADTVMLNGTVEKINVTAGPAYLNSSTNGICFDITSISGSNATLVLSNSAPGEYGIFIDTNITAVVSAPNGSAVQSDISAYNLQRHPLVGFFGQFDLGNGTYSISLPNASSSFRMVIMEKVEAPGEGHHHGLNDPHFWVDPLSAKVQVENILKAFIERDPLNAPYYRENADNLKSRLDKLDLDFSESLKSRRRNEIITTHEGFDYLADRYGFNATGAIGISGDAQPSPSDLARLTDLVHSLGLHYVFSEPIFNDAVIKTIAGETGTTVLVLDGAHGRSGVHAGWTYFEIMRDNLRNLRIGLEVPGAN